MPQKRDIGLTRFNNFNSVLPKSEPKISPLCVFLMFVGQHINCTLTRPTAEPKWGQNKAYR